MATTRPRRRRPGLSAAAWFYGGGGFHGGPLHRPAPTATATPAPAQQPARTPYVAGLESEYPIRVQVVVGDILVAEWVARRSHALETLNRYTRRRYASGLPNGASTWQRADAERFWDVPVGGDVRAVRG